MLQLDPCLGRCKLPINGHLLALRSRSQAATACSGSFREIRNFGSALHTHGVPSYELRTCCTKLMLVGRYVARQG